jgi:hypothetical protein
MMRVPYYAQVLKTAPGGGWAYRPPSWGTPPGPRCQPPAGDCPSALTSEAGLTSGPRPKTCTGT